MVDFWSSLSQDWDLDKSPLFGLSLTFILLLKREVEETSYVVVAFLTRKAKRTIKHSTRICKMLFPFGCILLQKKGEKILLQKEVVVLLSTLLSAKLILYLLQKVVQI